MKKDHKARLKKYKPLELDYNVQCAVENLRTAYWSNEPEKVAKDFTEAEDIIISSICHHGYTVCKRPQGEWIGIEEYDDYPYKKICECSECGKVIYISHNDFPNFCENCGAKMR